MIRYWTNFVRSGDPNVSGMPMSPPLAPWPPFKKNQDVLQLGPSIQPVDVYATHNCAFWNGFPH